MHDSTQQPPTHPQPPRHPPKALHYVNLLQEEPQQHFYNIHQNRGKACVRVVCDVLPAERLWSLNTIALALKARRGEVFFRAVRKQMLTVENDWWYGGARARICRCRMQQEEETSFLFWGNKEKKKKQKKNVRSSEHHCRKWSEEKTCRWRRALSMRGIMPWNARPFFTALCINKGRAPYKKVISQCCLQNNAAQETTVGFEAEQCSFYLLKWRFNDDSNVSKSFFYDRLACERENGIPGHDTACLADLV